ncbi:MAG: hypothetical protein WEB53_10620 [Akkermansiaceae bacterium]
MKEYFDLMAARIKGESPSMRSNFNYSANLTKILLLEVLAQRCNSRTHISGKVNSKSSLLLPGLIGPVMLKSPVAASCELG